MPHVNQERHTKDQEVLITGQTVPLDLQVSLEVLQHLL